MQKIDIRYISGYDASKIIKETINIIPSHWMELNGKRVKIFVVSLRQLPNVPNVWGHHDTIRKHAWSIRKVTSADTQQMEMFVNVVKEIPEELTYLFKRDIVTTFILESFADKFIEHVTKETMSEWSATRYTLGHTLAELIAAFIIDKENAEECHPQCIRFITELNKSLFTEISQGK